MTESHRTLCQRNPLEPRSPDALQGGTRCSSPALGGWISCLIVWFFGFNCLNNLAAHNRLKPRIQAKKAIETELRVQIGFSLTCVPIRSRRVLFNGQRELSVLSGHPGVCEWAHFLQLFLSIPQRQLPRTLAPHRVRLAWYLGW